MCNEMEEQQSTLKRASGYCPVCVRMEQKLFSQTTTVMGGETIEEPVIGVTIQVGGLEL